MCVDGFTVPVCQYYTSSSTTPVNVTITWNTPSPVGWVYMLNRIGDLTAVTTGQTVYVEAVNQDGTLTGTTQTMPALQLATFNFAPTPTAPPSVPDPASAFQLDEVNRNLLVRYIRVEGASGQYLHFKGELQLDFYLSHLLIC